MTCSKKKKNNIKEFLNHELDTLQKSLDLTKNEIDEEKEKNKKLIDEVNSLKDQLQFNQQSNKRRLSESNDQHPVQKKMMHIKENLIECEQCDSSIVMQ